ncbi:MAG: ABC transporter permease [Deltaproteobacteria bacterium]|nr:ABC transporter permease [Deltaproteobacteria bacterium]MBW1978881.1 ABC transporter permease [Deltaproteobacteria bacterium]MBW2299168.1 ABC transporter permease [Deltaproteobacteria bacterium]
MGVWKRNLKLILHNPMGMFGVATLSTFALLAIFAPLIMPYDPMKCQYIDGELARLQPPSMHFLLGTTHFGRDVLSQVIIGSRVALIVGSLAAIFLTFIGTNIGLVAGYCGGRVDSLLMRLTDIAFGIPFIPFAFLLIALVGPSIWNIIIVISFLMWRTTARVIRSQVLSLKERPFITAAKVSGASHLRIMYVHILPNVLPMSFLYIALGIAWSTLSEASLSFLGIGDPRMISWGQMLYYAFITGSARTAWWYVLPPGICIALFVISAFMVGQAYEEVVNPRLRKRNS